MTRTDRIKEDLKLVPKKPGSYQMYNKNHEIIYVGKAKNLSNRLKSYFTGSHDAKTTKMVSDVEYFKYIVTSSELEALLLELNLIKENRPKYNIMLMDDKSYPYILITNETHPRVLVTRDIKKIKKNSKLFGPYPNVKTCRDTVEILNKVYPFRKCNQIPKKSCLYYDMKQCLAPCIHNIKSEEYKEAITSVSKFLNGNNDELLNTLKLRMINASNNLEFEKALEYRDIIENIEKSSSQKIILNDKTNRDIFGYAVKDDILSIQVFHMRNGNIIERTGQVFDIVDDVEEMLITYIIQFYQELDVILPKEIIIPFIENIELLENLIKTKIIIPIKGTKKQLVDLVSENARINLENLQIKKINNLSKTTEPIEELGKLLNIEYPKVIEIFDNSNIQGSSAVSAMVTYIDGVKSPKDYRKYKVKQVIGADDYHTMIEIISRRVNRIIKDNLRTPNLFIVDGGIPQVKAAKEAIMKSGLYIPVMGLAKDDKHRTRAIINEDLIEINIDRKSNLFLLLESMQDEVHRFAITFFRNTHSKTMLESELDNIEGIGKNRKQLLLSNFDNIEEIKNASNEKLKSLGIPEKTIQVLKEKLN